MSFSWLGAATCVYSGGLDEGRAEIYFPSYIMRFIFGAFLCLFAFSYAFSIGLISWVVPAELFPLRARGKASSLTTACHAASGLLSAFLLKIWLATGYDTAAGMMGFSVVSIFIAFFAFVAMPETKGLMLEDMEELFALVRSLVCPCVHLSSHLSCIPHHPFTPHPLCVQDPPPAAGAADTTCCGCFPDPKSGLMGLRTLPEDKRAASGGGRGLKPSDAGDAAKVPLFPLYFPLSLLLIVSPSYCISWGRRRRVCCSSPPACTSTARACGR